MTPIPLYDIALKKLPYIFKEEDIMAFSNSHEIDIAKLLLRKPPDIDPSTCRAEDYYSRRVNYVIDLLKEYTHNVQHKINTKRGLKLAVDIERIPKGEIVPKNFAWLTQVAIIRLPPFDFNLGEDPTTTIELHQMAKDLSHKLSRFEKLIEYGIVIPLPSKIIRHRVVDWDLPDRIDELSLGNDIVEPYFKNPFLISQFTEEQKPVACGAIELLLPQVRELPIESILSLRNDRGEGFERFQYQLSYFLRKSDKADSEQTLIDLLEHIDAEIYQLRSEFDDIAKKKRLQVHSLAYSFGVLALVFVLPSEIYKSIAALFGSSSILKSLQNIRLLDFEKARLRTHSFYFPYKLSQLGGQL